MSKQKREYTMEFKQKAVELSHARGNAAEVCRELGLNPSVLGRWRREARIVRANRLFAKRKRKFRVTTDSRHDYPIAPNILDRDFTVHRKNQVWVSDMTRIRTGEGWMYLTVIMDPFQRKVVGRSMGKTLGTADTIIPAWKMAIRSNNTTDRLIFHSDRNSQYASYEFADILKEHNGPVVQSMSRKGNCWDKAVAESFFKSLKVEWVYHQNYSFRSEAELSIFEWIETWYNRSRTRSTLDYKTIEEFENEMYNQKSEASEA